VKKKEQQQQQQVQSLTWIYERE